MKQGWHNSKIRSPIKGVLFLVVLCSMCIISVISPASESNYSLPELKPNASPLDKVNRPVLLERFIAAFDREYAKRLLKNKSKDLSNDMAVYYLRQELQALVDMWRATGKSSYLEQAKNHVIISKYDLI